MARDQQKKVLRIGIIQDGKIVQERLIKAGEPVSVGESAKNTFVFPKTSLPSAEYELFSHAEDGYALRVCEGMRGKLSAGGAVVGLDKVRRDETTTRDGDAWLLPLTEQDRGKLSIDHVTVLFQFVPPPPVQAVRPMEAMDFRPRLLDDDDPLFLGFLAIWTALASVLLVWVTNAEPPDIQSVEIPDRFARVIMDPEPRDKTEDPEIDKSKTGAELPTERVEKKKSPVEKAPAKKKAGESKVDEARRKAKLEQDIRQNSLIAKLIGTTGESNSKTAALYGEGDELLDDLDSALKEVGGVRVAGVEQDGPRTGTGTSDEDADIGDLASVGGGNAEVGDGPAVEVSGDVALGTGADYADVTDADGVTKTVQRNYGQLKYCYETRLKQNPSLSGRVEVEWNVRQGRVTSVSVFANTTGDDAFANCITGKIRRWRFDDGVEGEILYPFIFTPRT